MIKPLSEQLADLSARAKSAEDAVAAAQEEAHDKLNTRKQQARLAAMAATDRVNQQIESVGDDIAKNWNAAKAKVSADMTALREDIAQVKQDVDVRHATARADRLEWEAGLSVDYAIAALEQAKLAVFDALDARLAADAARKAG